MNKIKRNSLLILMLVFVFGITACALLLYAERYFIPVSGWAFAVVLSTVIIILTYFSIKGKDMPGWHVSIAAFLPSTAIVFGFCTAIIMDPYRLFACSVAIAVVGIACSIILFLIFVKVIVTKIVIGVIDAMILYIVVTMAASAVSGFLASGRIVDRTLESPGGKYQAQVVKAVDGETVKVNTVKISDNINIIIGTLEPWENTVYSGKDAEIIWKNDEVLVIDGKEYPAEGENKPFAEQ